MPNELRSRDAENSGALLAAVGIVLAFALTWGGGFLQGREGERRERIPASYSAAAKADAERACAGREAAATFDCIYQKMAASQEQARGEQDLSAQQRAASSALAAAVIAFLTLLVTIIGVWLVKRTLDATLQAVRDTSRATDAMLRQNAIAEHGQRPWLIGKAQLFSGIFRKGEPRIRILVTAKNVGEFPAVDVRVYTGVSHTPDIEYFASLKNSIGGQHVILAPGEEFAERVEAIAFQDDYQVPLADDEHRLIYVYVAILYQSVGNSAIFQFGQYYQVSSSQGVWFRPEDIGDIEVPVNLYASATGSMMT
jgi:hypothetical protein